VRLFVILGSEHHGVEEHEHDDEPVEALRLDEAAAAAPTAPVPLVEALAPSAPPALAHNVLLGAEVALFQVARCTLCPVKVAVLKLFVYRFNVF